MAHVSDHELIRNAIALCCIAFDSKDWSLLERSYTADCVVHYPEPLGLLTGLHELQDRIRRAIGDAKTQHALTTQYIGPVHADDATATTYCRGIHFLDDRHFFAEAKYEDQLVKISPSEWRIKERTVTVMGVPQGDWSILG